MPDQDPKRLSWRGKLLLALGVGLCCALLGEIGARILLRGSFRAGERRASSWSVVARFDSSLGWANEPQARAEVVTQDVRYRASINSLGFRDPPMLIEKRSGKRRVLFLGDSMTWGWGVNDGERFTDLVAGALGERVEIFNAAVPGYGTDQQLWTLEARGGELAPDLIVLVFVLNDIPECERAVAYDMHKPRFVLEQGSWRIEGRPVADPRPPLRRWLGSLPVEVRSHSALWTHLERWRKDAVPAKESEPRARAYNPQFAAQVLEVCERMHDPSTPARHALGLIRAWCAQHSIPLGVVVLPHKHDQYLYEPTSGRPPSFDGTTALTKALSRVAAELDFPLLSIDAQMFEATGKGLTLHCGDGHFNAAGNRMLAEALIPRIEAWLPPPR